MPNKLTDNEIKKALECCLANTNDDCSVCHFSGSNQSCIDVLIQYALDLINRQDEEINRLQAENERLKEEIKKEQLYNLRMTAYSIKAEAYKEFAERLKENSIATFSWEGVVMVEEIDNLLKEKVGDNNG